MLPLGPKELSEAREDRQAPDSAVLIPRSTQLRDRYLRRALADLPRLLGSIDRNPFRSTYGCLDREYWHYRTAAFPSGMYQEGVLALAMVYAHPLPGNPWYGCTRVRQLAEAGIRFAARSSHPDGSCDDYYPLERALGAAVFSLVACARAYDMLRLDDPELLDWLRRRARWLVRHSETGRLTNHHALAALGLWYVARITGQEEFLQAASQKLQTVLAWQHPEGWFDEYGGADPGYQTLTIDCLAKLRRFWENWPGKTWEHWSQQNEEITQALARAVRFARWFLHPDFSYGGHYGSRGTRLFFPHGMELLAGEIAEAADLADGFLLSLEGPLASPSQRSPTPVTPCPEAFSTCALLSDDRMLVHWPAHLLDAYLDWTPCRAAHSADSVVADSVFFAGAGLWVRRTPDSYTVVSTARGGAFIHFPPNLWSPAQAPPRSSSNQTNPEKNSLWPRKTSLPSGAVFGQKGFPIPDAGLVVETTDGRLAVSSLHQRPPEEPPQVSASEEGSAWMVVRGRLCWVRYELASPFKQALFYLGMSLMGRWVRNGVRWFLQRRLITGRRQAPIRLIRTLELPAMARPAGQSVPTSKVSPTGQTASLLQASSGEWTLRVTDRMELLSRRIKVRRMAYGSEADWVYVAATGQYQPSVLVPWIDLAEYVDPLNRTGQVVIVREW